MPYAAGVSRSSVVSIEVEPLSIPLREPFVIATGRIDTTRAALVRATLEDEGGRRATGLGEAAALPPVTREDQPELLAAIAAAAPALRGAAIAGVDDVAALVGARPARQQHRARRRRGGDPRRLGTPDRPAAVRRARRAARTPRRS